MKIIFDNKEQEKTFFETIAGDYCPSIFGLNNLDNFSCTGFVVNCEECWLKSGIEWEVVGNE